MMKKELTFRAGRLKSAVWLMFLSPALRLIPARTARLCGKSMWISVIWSVPILLLYVLFLRRLTTSADDGEGLASLIIRCLGEKGGRIIAAVFGVWFVVYCGFTLRAGAGRMITTVYPGASPAVFIAVTAGLAFIASLGSEQRLMRCAGLIVPPVAAVLIFVLICACPSVDIDCLLPLSAYDVLYSSRGALAAADAAVLPLYLSLFLAGGKGERTEGGFVLVIAMTALAFWINICIAGSFGAELTARLTQPFFVLVRNIVLFHTVERLEAVVVSLWVFSDFMLTSVCLFASSSIFRLCMGKRCGYEGERAFDVNNGRWVIWLCALFAAVFALVFAPTQDSLILWSEKLIPYTNLLLAFAVLPLVYLIGRFRKAV
ncbi:MAG: GerAB/ArcD/ProY family transporter [Eubacteriales bacterium]|nr:GerAB/ArcD/ProY family transporter [Eubacteriales bacterium]